MAFCSTDAVGQTRNSLLKTSSMQILSGLPDISVYLGCSKKTVLKWIREEGLPAAKVGGLWITDKVKIDAWRIKKIGNLD